MDRIKEELKQLKELAQVADISFKGRQRLRKRDAKKLLTISTDAVGLACKAIAAVDADDADAKAKALFGMTNEAWDAYDLLMHLAFSDWEESEVMAYGRTPDVCQNDN